MTTSSQTIPPTTRTVDSTVTDPRAKQQLSARGARRLVQHLLLREDVEFAKPLGIEVKTLCGLWSPPRSRFEDVSNV